MVYYAQLMTLIGMTDNTPELHKLDKTDRHTLAWLIANVHPKSTKSWITFIANDYKRRKGITINVSKLFKEIKKANISPL